MKYVFERYIFSRIDNWVIFNGYLFGKFWLFFSLVLIIGMVLLIGMLVNSEEILYEMSFCLGGILSFVILLIKFLLLMM